MKNSKQKTFIISDIHGCLEELELLINLLPLTRNSQLIFLGDYIDRGENSRKVIDYILYLKERYSTITLMGNHEEMFIHFLENRDTKEASSFVFNGGGATLASYGDNYGNYNIPSHHLDFLKSLPLSYELDNFYFVHAGLPDKPIGEINPAKDRTDLLWIRKKFYKSTYQWAKTVIHGHTPLDECYISDKRINVDTGCAYGNKLSALQLPDLKVFSIYKRKPVKLYYLKNEDSRRSAVRFAANLPVRIKHNDMELLFFTVNYSEFGMLFCDEMKNNNSILPENSIITGLIGENIYDQVPFAGRIIRRDTKHSKNYYAIKFTLQPFDSSPI